jgi:hypothetical protein
MWYLNDGLKPQGPLELSEVQDKIKKGHLSPRDLIFSQTTGEWKPAHEWEELRKLGFPAFEAIGTHSENESVWVVLHLDRSEQSYKQEGPFANNDIIQAVRAGKLAWEDLVWKKGLSGWARVMDRQEFISPGL